MRVLIINYEFPPIGAGGGKASQKIAAALVEMGHTVRVITSRPTQLYTFFGNVSVLLGLGFWLYLIYAKFTWDEDISNHGFTTLGTLLLLTGIIPEPADEGPQHLVMFGKPFDFIRRHIRPPARR